MNGVNVVALSLALGMMLSPAAMGGTGNLQFIYTAYLDVEGLFPNTLQACEAVDKSTLEPLQAAFAEWNLTHAPYQAELQQLVEVLVPRVAGKDKAAEAMQEIRRVVREEMAPQHFPQNYKFRDNVYCTKLLPQYFKGERLMLNFKTYVEYLKQELATQAKN